jgi:hypothetical protein
MKRKIVVDTGEVKQIAHLQSCTEQMVYLSLRFKKNSPLARRIRKLALLRGGIDTDALVRANEGGAA